MVQVIWTPTGKRWLKKAHDFVAEDDPETAQRVIRGILQKVELLGRFPYLGAAYEMKGAPGLRVLIHGHYRIPYLITADAVEVWGAFHERMDFERHLKKQR